jgi:hypothetical protein
LSLLEVRINYVVRTTSLYTKNYQFALVDDPKRHIYWKKLREVTWQRVLNYLGKLSVVMLPVLHSCLNFDDSSKLLLLQTQCLLRVGLYE